MPLQELNLEEAMQQIEERSLYAAPFPHDEDLDSLAAVFAAHAPVNSVRMRRHLNSKDFRGSVFVEFASKEDAERVRNVAQGDALHATYCIHAVQTGVHCKQDAMCTTAAAVVQARQCGW